MGNKKRLVKMIERETEYFEKQEPGTEEYVASQERLKDLVEQLARRNDGVCKSITEAVKVGGGILLPVFGWVVITAFEKNDSFSTSLKKTLDCFIPKRL